LHLELLLRRASRKVKRSDAAKLARVATKTVLQPSMQ
jgi:hypothetical protein